MSAVLALSFRLLFSRREPITKAGLGKLKRGTYWEKEWPCVLLVGWEGGGGGVGVKRGSRDEAVRAVPRNARGGTQAFLSIC
ncbi:hypothetical protein CBR_g37209 [Chara braunii]|uniref:Uncharacterized protein n=1 Tax=Chara braunii TaxID=69332 RepID=A0A388LMD7_CHABU|nr:hypothetical protein CBR_g37209 [Chara braunii]|eukprot:GBG83496.1 hypothetical protein CBR_g37209 [Chara braunii]